MGKKNKIYQICGLKFYHLPIAAYLAISLCYQISMQEFMHFQTYTFCFLAQGGGRRESNKKIRRPFCLIQIYWLTIASYPLIMYVIQGENGITNVYPFCLIQFYFFAIYSYPLIMYSDTFSHQVRLTDFIVTNTVIFSQQPTL